MKPDQSSCQDTEIQLVIFDLDGVLIDSEIISAHTIIDLAAEHGAEIDLLYVRRNFIGKSFATVMSILETNFQIALPADFEANYLKKLTERFERDLKPLPGALEVVAGLRVKSCIATSSSLDRAKKSLQLTGLFGPFEHHLYSSSMVAKPKPAPDLFEFACLREGISPAYALVVEDSVAGLEAGLAAGIETVRFVGGSHLKGLPAVNKPPELIKSVFDSWSNFRCHYPELFI